MFFSINKYNIKNALFFDSTPYTCRREEKELTTFFICPPPTLGILGHTALYYLYLYHVMIFSACAYAVFVQGGVGEVRKLERIKSMLPEKVRYIGHTVYYFVTVAHRNYSFSKMSHWL